MATILRHGKTPAWGVFNRDSVTTSQDNSGIILDSYNFSAEVKDYEQLNESGQVVGYMVYDQTVNFDMSGTILYDAPLGSDGVSGEAFSCSPNNKFNANKGVGSVIDNIDIHNKIPFAVNTDINTPKYAIIKSISVNTSQGNAATFSASGSIYDISISTCLQ